MAAAAQLTIDEAKLALQKINEQNREFYSDRRGIGALKDLQQTFPNPWLYVAELLQNAIDEGATRISISIAEDQNLIFEHNGKAFSLADVEALCARGVSAKGANTVGFMGVGFKSVFRSFEHVQVSSGPWRFALTVPIHKGDEYGDQQRHWLGAVLPVSDSSIEIPSSGMTCRFVLSRRLPDPFATRGGFVSNSWGKQNTVAFARVGRRTRAQLEWKELAAEKRRVSPGRSRCAGLAGIQG